LWKFGVERSLCLNIAWFKHSCTIQRTWSKHNITCSCLIKCLNEDECTALSFPCYWQFDILSLLQYPKYPICFNFRMVPILIFRLWLYAIFLRFNLNFFELPNCWLLDRHLPSFHKELDQSIGFFFLLKFYDIPSNWTLNFLSCKQKYFLSCM
jgi:hypothetical protein